MRQVEDIRHITDLWQRIAEALNRSEPVVLATIVRRRGSGPREAKPSCWIVGTPCAFCSR